VAQLKDHKGVEAKKAERREQLIKSTMRCIAGQGLSSVTMATITKDAGLSMGLANLHFQSKERLLNETLAYVHDKYVSGIEAIDARGLTSPAENLLAQVSWDFSAKVANRELLAVWFAFWGEAKSRPTYKKICSERDQLMNQNVQQLCQQIIEEGSYQDVDADDVSAGLCCLIEGLWLDILIAPKKMSRDRGYRIAVNYLAASFPNHITRI